MTDTQIAQMTQAQGEDIAKLQARFESFTEHVHGEHSAMMERIEIRMKAVEERQTKSEEKHKLIDELRINMAKFSDQLTTLNNNVTSLTALLQDQRDDTRERLTHLEHNNKELQDDLQDVKDDLREAKEDKKGVYKQIFGAVLSVAASLLGAWLMLRFNIGG